MSVNATSGGPARLAPLDSLRGVAALSVALFSHFQHFGGDKSSYPFVSIAPFAWLYDSAAGCSSICSSC